MEKTVIVIGAGPGGYIAAIRAAQLGAKVTVVEQGSLGGTCLNVGCIPTKSIIHSAQIYSLVKDQGPACGIRADNLRVDFPAVMAKKNAVVKRMVTGVGGLFRANRIEVVRGTASFADAHTVLVKGEEEQTICADAVIIAAGSVSARPPIPGIDTSVHCVDSTGALSFEKLPERLAVIGGGVIGLELACAYEALGSRVTIVEALDHILPMLDPDVGQILIRHMKKMGIQLHLSCKVQSVSDRDGYSVLTYTDAEGSEQTVEADKVLVAVGRRSNTAALDLDLAGIHHDRGRIIVDDHLRTNVPEIYAIGDCVMGHAMLAHAASAMGEAAAQNALGMDTVYDEGSCASCLYLDPEAAAVGLTLEKAKEKYGSVLVGNFPMMANGKAVIANGGEGAVRIIARSEDHGIVGMQIVGPRASDLIAEGASAIHNRLTLDDLIDTIHAHPTISEAVREAALDAEGRALNMPPSRK